VLVLELDVVLMGPVVDVDPAAGWYFSSESKQAPSSNNPAPSAAATEGSRGDRADEARGLEDIAGTVASNRARDESPYDTAGIRLAHG
jgi:hypothetical protein